MPFLEINGLRKRYGRVDALDGLTLAAEGGVYGLIGPNGAGKTTALSIVMGILRADGGTVRVGGLDPGRDPVAVKRITGYLPEEPFFYDYLTGAETLSLAAAAHRVRWRDDPFLREWTEALEMKGHLDQLVGHYSHGMRQKLGLLLSILHHPPLLLWDEPYVGLDFPSQERVRDLMRALTARGCTLLLSTHVLPLVEAMADRVGFILGGRLRWEGDNPGELAPFFQDRSDGSPVPALP
jgi:ABC-2 type transport system ATP-binding protein